MTQAAPATRGPFRLTAFRAGFLTGLACLILGIGGLYALPRPTEPPSRATDPNVTITSPGATLTTHGAVRLQIDDGRGRSFVQSCNGACDDLDVQMRSGDNGLRVRAVGAAGQTLLDHGEYVTTEVRSKMTVIGGKQLQLGVQRGLAPTDLSQHRSGSPSADNPANDGEHPDRRLH